MRCREARPLLSARLDDELNAGDSERLECHVEGCARCRGEIDAYAALRTGLRLSEPLTVDLMPALRDRLAGEPVPAFVSLDPASSRRRGAPSRMFAAVAVVAVAAVIVAVVMVARPDTPVDVVTTPPAAAPELRAPNGASLLLAWTTNGLPDRALEQTSRLVGVAGVTEVRGAALRLTSERDARGEQRLSLPPGAAIPIDALAIDPAGYARDLPASAARIVRALPRDGALLGATSARVRGIGVGGSLTFGATTVRVTGVVPDSLVGAAEIVVRSDSPLAISTPRFLLVAYHGDRSELETAILTALPKPVRFRAPGETPYLRHGDAVLPQALVKARFGEFWYRVDARGTVTIDPRWVAHNIVTIAVPGVGQLRVHRFVAAELRRALAAADFGAATRAAAAFEPQLISPALGLSRHTWGIGLSLHTVPDAQARTIAKLAQFGFRWGGLWLNRSPDYYEWVGGGTG